MSLTDPSSAGSYVAGRQGPEVRSDLFVTFDPEAAGVEIEIRSRVEPYYGPAIRRQAAELLAQLGVTRGRLGIVDAGALPFVLAARIESAVRRAFPDARLADPSATFSSATRGAESPRDRLRRSRLYLPGAEPKYMLNAALHEADGLILDLEDSVHPNEKGASRILVRNALLALDFRGAERMVRINQLPLGLADLEEIVPALPDLILIPKVESVGQVKAVDEAVTRILAGRGLSRTVWLMPILESALGIENAFAIASASERIAALTIGLEDYTADLGVVKTVEGAESVYARSRVVNAAKAAGAQAIDSVFGDVEDLTGLSVWARRSRGMGFEGMGCVHPRQIPVIHEGFAPTPVEIEKSLRLVAAFEEAKARGLGVVSLGSKMIDAPVVQRAVRLVEQARAMGLVKENR